MAYSQKFIKNITGGIELNLSVMSFSLDTSYAKKYAKVNPLPTIKVRCPSILKEATCTYILKPKSIKKIFTPLKLTKNCEIVHIDFVNRNSRLT